MRHTRTFILAAVLGGLIALPALADAQGRAAPRGGGGGGGGRPAGGGGGGGGRPPGGAVGAPGHAVPRPGGAPYRGHYYAPYRGAYYGGHPWYGYGGYPWYGGYYGYPYGLSFGIGFGFGYPYAYGYGYPAYGYPGYAVPAYGGVRIAVPQRDAEVYVDGYYAGVVDDFDGSLQKVNLEPGPHQIAVRGPGLEPMTFEVNVEPGRTITYRAALRQAQP